MPLSLATNISMKSQTAVSSGGSSATRYSFAGTKLRWPTTSLAMTGSNTFFAVEFYYGSPAYATTEPRFFMPAFWSPTGTSTPGSGEVRIAQDITIQGVAISLDGTTWYACDGAAEAGVATVATSGTSPGALLPKISGVTIPANTVVRCRVTGFMAGTGAVLPYNPAQSTFTGVVPDGGSIVNERVEGSTTTRFARLSATGGNLSNSGGVFYTPSFVVAKGGDGRQVGFLPGNSILYGANHSLASSTWTSRYEFGYIPMGLDSTASGARRIAYGNFGIPGQSPVGSAAGTNGWSTASNWGLKRAALQAVYDLQNDWPFDFILTEHITNSVPYTGTLQTAMVAYYTLLQGYGKPIYQVEGLAHPTSTDGFQTTGNQTPVSGFAYPAGQLWTFNADVGGANGLGDPTAYYRANGYIAGSIAPWRLGSADTTTGRDKLAVQSFSTTLASAYVSGNVVSLTASPTLGSILNVKRDSGTYWGGTVTAISGSGPYSVTLSSSTGSGAGAIGNVVQESLHDTAGLHPSTRGHLTYMPAVVAWKADVGL